MVHVMISLDKDKEVFLRRLARRRYGNRHGAISAVVVEGLEALRTEEIRERAVERQLELMRKGFDLGFKGGKLYEKRSELYER